MTAQAGLAGYGDTAVAVFDEAALDSLVAEVAAPDGRRVARRFRPVAAVRWRAALAATAGLYGAVTIGLLHVLPGSRGLNPLSNPISNYALTRNAWVFDTGVLGLALGLVALLSALVRSGCVSTSSPSFAVLSACCAGLVAVVIFPDRSSHGTLTTAAKVHWAAAMCTFGGLAIAPALVGHGRAAECSRLPRVARRLSVTAGTWFTVLLGGSIIELATSVHSALLHIGGLVERALATTEILIVAVLTMWAWRGCPCRREAPSW